MLLYVFDEIKELYMPAFTSAEYFTLCKSLQASFAAIQLFEYSFFLFMVMAGFELLKDSIDVFL